MRSPFLTQLLRNICWLSLKYFTLFYNIVDVFFLSPLFSYYVLCYPSFKAWLLSTYMFFFNGEGIYTLGTTNGILLSLYLQCNTCKCERWQQLLW